jgi:hypothetical protein
MGRHDARYRPANVRALTSVLRRLCVSVTIGSINLHGGKTDGNCKKEH